MFLHNNIMSRYFGNVRKKMHPFVTFLLTIYCYFNILTCCPQGREVGALSKFLSSTTSSFWSRLSSSKTDFTAVVKKLIRLFVISFSSISVTSGYRTDNSFFNLSKSVIIVLFAAIANKCKTGNEKLSFLFRDEIY